MSEELGTEYVNDTHPEQYGTIKQVTMAASTKGSSYYSDNCLEWSGSAQVTNCDVNEDIFYLYKSEPDCVTPQRKSAQDQM